MSTVRIEEVVGAIVAWASGDDPAAESALHDMLTDILPGEMRHFANHKLDPQCALKRGWKNRYRHTVERNAITYQDCVVVGWLADHYGLSRSEVAHLIAWAAKNYD